MRILLLSAYDAVSHRLWREGLVAALPEHNWTVLALPPRHFRWRIRGNSLSWGVGERSILLERDQLPVIPDISNLSWSVLQGPYRQAIDELGIIEKEV